MVYLNTPVSPTLDLLFLHSHTIESQLDKNLSRTDIDRDTTDIDDAEMDQVDTPTPLFADLGRTAEAGAEVQLPTSPKPPGRPAYRPRAAGVPGASLGGSGVIGGGRVAKAARKKPYVFIFYSFYPAYPLFTSQLS
jgi:hypothetical protein